MTNLNHNRASRLGKALRRYAFGNDDRSNLIDMLTDARHWCDRHGEAYAKLDRIAYDHYTCEVVEQRKECR